MNRDASPLVSVIVPSFNQGRFIRETIASCLAQDYRPIEILVMDGGSTDETPQVLASFGSPELSWISERDAGVVDAVNKGLVKARGEIITIQSSDDVFLPGALAAAVAALHANPDAGLVYGDVELIDEKSNLLGADVQPPFDFTAYLGRLQYIPQPGTCFTRAAFQSVGGWREEVSYVADADLWMRIATLFPVLKINRLVARYRYHDEQRDKQRARLARDWSRAVQDLIDGGSLDARQVRFARMGKHLADYRYAMPADWAARTRALYGALVANPPGFFDSRIPKAELMPGRVPLWQMMSRIKRKLGFAPRRH